jgi:hypothetical protein
VTGKYDPFSIAPTITLLISGKNYCFGSRRRRQKHIYRTSRRKSWKQSVLPDWHWSYKESINSCLPDGMTWIVDVPAARSRSSELVSAILWTVTFMIDVDKLPYFPVTGPRQVKIMDHTGKEKKFFQFDGNKKPLFSLPIRIASNSRNNIGVIDCLSFYGMLRCHHHCLIYVWYGHTDQLQQIYLKV